MFLPKSSMVFSSLKGAQKSFLANQVQLSRCEGEARKPTRVTSANTSAINTANDTPAKDGNNRSDRTLSQKISMKDLMSRKVHQSLSGIVKGTNSLKESKSLSSMIPSFLGTEQLMDKKLNLSKNGEENAHGDGASRPKSKYFSMINQFFTRKASVSRDPQSQDKPSEATDLKKLFDRQINTKYSSLFRGNNRSVSRDVSEVSMPSYYFKNLQYYIRYNSKSEFAKKTVAHFKECFEAIHYSLTIRKPSDETVAKSKLKMMGYAGAHPNCNLPLTSQIYARVRS